MTANEKYKHERKRYLAGEITHRQFYSWVASLIGLNPSLVPATVKEIQESKDRYFNDIPPIRGKWRASNLTRWDDKHPIVSTYATAAGLVGWSCSDTVCVLKELAEQIREREVTRNGDESGSVVDESS